ncbi:HTH domain-containing protein, partial [bacterium]|nr:HTH domain-containing protein [bacterium]
EKARAKEVKIKKIEKVSVDVLPQGGEKKEKNMDMDAIKSDVVIDYEELSSIQLKTLEILQNKGFLKASQISQHFEDTSERSIRREIKELKDKSIIVSKGSGKSTFYELNHVY